MFGKLMRLTCIPFIYDQIEERSNDIKSSSLLLLFDKDGLCPSFFSFPMNASEVDSWSGATTDFDLLIFSDFPTFPSQLDETFLKKHQLLRCLHRYAQLFCRFSED